MRLAQTLEVESPEVLGGLGGQRKVLTIEEIISMKPDRAEMRIEGILPTEGLMLVAGPSKTGKTLFAAQLGLSVAAGVPLVDYYAIAQPGPVLFLEKDDSAGAAALGRILRHTRIPTAGIPFHTVATEEAARIELGADLADWLDCSIRAHGYGLVILDSYTALRAARTNGNDFVKCEEADLKLLDHIGKKNGASILLIHHYSKGSINHDWSERAAGSFAMAAATEGQIVITRFPDAAGNARERLVRIRGRRFEESEMVLRFEPEHLDFEMLYAGAAAPFYPDIANLKATFGGGSFSPKSLTNELGMSRVTAHRLLNRLVAANAVRKTGYGEYVVEVQF